MHVHGTGETRHTGLDLLGNLVVLRAIAAHHLDIDRGGQAKVQNLSHNIGGLEKERQLWELLRQRLAQLLNVLPGGAVLVLEGHEDLSVPRAHCGIIAKRQIEASPWQADVVQNECQVLRGDRTTDGGFDLAKERFGLFEAGTSRGPDVEAKLASVDLWEKVLPNQQEQPQGPAKGEHAQHHHRQAMPQGPVKVATIAIAEALKAPVEGVVHIPDEIP